MKLNIDEILKDLKAQEKTASAEKSLLDVLTETSVTASVAAPATEKVATVEATPATPATIEAPVAKTDAEIFEKAAELEETKIKLAQADMMGRALARAYYDELQQMGIMGAVNYPQAAPVGTGEAIMQPFPYGPGQPQMAQKQASVNDDAADILTALYTKFAN